MDCPSEGAVIPVEFIEDGRALLLKGERFEVERVYFHCDLNRCDYVIKLRSIDPFLKLVITFL